MRSVCGRGRGALRAATVVVFNFPSRGQHFCSCSFDSPFRMSRPKFALQESFTTYAPREERQRRNYGIVLNIYRCIFIKEGKLCPLQVAFMWYYNIL